MAVVVEAGTIKIKPRRIIESISSKRTQKESTSCEKIEQEVLFGLNKKGQVSQSHGRFAPDKHTEHPLLLFANTNATGK